MRTRTASECLRSVATRLLQTKAALDCSIVAGGGADDDLELEFGATIRESQRHFEFSDLRRQIHGQVEAFVFAESAERARLR
jgi:hypothetical protein